MNTNYLNTVEKYVNDYIKAGCVEPKEHIISVNEDTVIKISIETNNIEIKNTAEIIDEYTDYLVENHNSHTKNDRTKKQYKTILREFKDFLLDNGIEIYNLNDEHISKYIEYLNTGLGNKPTTIKKKLVIVRELCEQLTINNITKLNPLKGVTNKYNNSQSIRNLETLDNETLNKLLKYIDNYIIYISSQSKESLGRYEKRNLKTILCTLLILEYGVRINEIPEIKKNDLIELFDKSFYINLRGISMYQRMIQINHDTRAERVLRLFLDKMELDKDDYLISPKINSPSNYNRWLLYILEDANINAHITAKNLRDTYLCKNMTPNINVLKDINKKNGFSSSSSVLIELNKSLNTKHK